MGLTSNLGKLSNMITSTGSAVGIAQPSPAYTLDVTGTGRYVGTLTLATTSLIGTLQFGTTSGASIGYDAGSGAMTYNITAGAVSSSAYYKFLADGNSIVTFLKGGNVGIGTTTINASTILAVAGSNTITDARGMLSVNTTNAYAADLGGSISLGGENGSGSTPYPFGKISGRKEGAGAAYSGYLSLATTFSDGTITERMRITSAGNVGIGVTPNDWYTGNSSKALQIGVAGVGIWGYGSTTNINTYLTNNAYYDSVGWKYAQASGKASFYQQNNGAHIWATTDTTGAAAGNVLSFTERMRISSTGNVAIGDTVTTYGKLYVNGYGAANSLMTQPVLIASSGANAVQLGSDGTNALIGAGNSGSSLILLSRVSGEYTQAIVIASNNTVKINNLGSGAVTATSGVLSTTSDMNLKVDDGFIDNALEKVMNLKPRYFHWKEESKLPTNIRQLGFYAQEVNAALGEEAANTPKTKNDKWGIYDRGIIAMLTKAIQELSAEIDKLKNK